MVESIRAKIESDTYAKRLALLGLDKNQVELNRLEQLKKDIDIAQAIIQQTALETQEQVKYSLEDIVNTMLDALFPDQYIFSIVFEIKRNRTEARIAILDKGQEVDALESLGGGVCDCISTSLRIALLLLTAKRRTLLLDEVGKYLSEDIKPAFYEILQRLSQDLGIQMIMVTHDECATNVATKIFTVTKDVDGLSVVQ